MKSPNAFQEINMDTCLENFIWVFSGENYMRGGMQGTLSETSSDTIQNAD